ncbi:MAG: helix-turn-helix transcriptional regulator [Thaumarchaeota archaeon]|nr:helix-turn-helix transcriptional regulator [Nitrososphaerota archaeon]
MTSTTYRLENATPYSLLFQAFTNPARVQILQALRDNESMNVTEIGEETGLEQTSLSHNLRCLAFCGLVTAKREGKSRVYSLNKATVPPMLEIARNHVRRYASNLLSCDALER